MAMSCGKSVCLNPFHLSPLWIQTIHTRGNSRRKAQAWSVVLPSKGFFCAGLTTFQWWLWAEHHNSQVILYLLCVGCLSTSKDGSQLMGWIVHAWSPPSGIKCPGAWRLGCSHWAMHLQSGPILTGLVSFYLYLTDPHFLITFISSQKTQVLRYLQQANPRGLAPSYLLSFSLTIVYHSPQHP